MSDLHYPLSDNVPGAGSCLEIRPGLNWLRLPIPFELNHINVWLLDDGQGWTLIDTGIAFRETIQAWETIFKSNLGNKPISRVIVTHHHPDHFGLAGWICDQFDVELQGTAAAIGRAVSLIQNEGDDVDSRTVYFQMHGADNPGRLARFTTGLEYRRLVSGLPQLYRNIDELNNIKIGKWIWKPVISNGHADGHLSLYCAEQGILISGDQILPTITSNLSLFDDDPDLNPLQEYLDSLDIMRQLPADTLVLPSHGRIFSGLHLRADAIEEAHRERSSQVRRICEIQSTVGAVCKRLFPKQLDDINTCLAFGETFTHVRYLEKQRLVECMDKDNQFLYTSI